MWIEVFKTGEHTSAEGHKKVYTEADLDNMAKIYNEQKEHEAPLVLGHPESNQPAFGWTKELKREGQKLMAYVEQVTDKVKEAVKAGMFKKVSIAIYGNGLLRHIGLLGAQVPAIKGLAPVQFKENEDTFEEIELTMRSSFKERLKELLAEIFGAEVADHALSPQGGDDTKLKTHQEAEMKPEEIQAMIDTAVKTATASFTEQITKIQTELKTEKDGRAADQLKHEEALKKQRFESAVTSFTTYCDGLIAEGKILPAERDALVEEYKDTYKAHSQMSYGEGEKPLTEKFMERLAKRPVIVDPKKANFHRKPEETGVDASFAEFGETLDAASIDLDKKIQAIAAERKCSYEEAALYFQTH